MIPFNKSETSLLKKILKLDEFKVVIYNDDNEIKVQDSKKVNEYTTKFTYSYLPPALPESDIIKMKDRGVSEFVRDPFYIQKQLKSATRNDRFKHLPAMVVGIDEEGNHYFYESGGGNKNKKVTLFGAVRLPVRSTIDTDLKNVYHVYSPFNKISKDGINDKNWSLKVLAWLLENVDKVEELKELFQFIIKGVLITHAITPDYIVTIKSSKPTNSELIKLFKADDYFKDTKILEVEKPSTRSIKKEYIEGDYDKSEYFDSLSMDDKVKMQGLSPDDRSLYSNIIKNIFDKTDNIKSLKDKNIIFIDDVITTGSTFSNILIPLFEKDNNILPFSFLIR